MIFSKNILIVFSGIISFVLCSSSLLLQNKLNQFTKSNHYHPLCEDPPRAKSRFLFNYAVLLPLHYKVIRQFKSVSVRSIRD